MPPQAQPKKQRTVPILSLHLMEEQDVVAARQRARFIAELSGFNRHDQVRIATAVSEIARNAFQYAGGGKVEFSLDSEDQPAFLITVSDNGPGIENIDHILSGNYVSQTGLGVGIVGARRLMDSFTLISTPGAGTRIVMGKAVPPNTRIDVAELTRQLSSTVRATPIEELSRQNADLLETIEQLHRREDELSRVSQELEDTNRGVMALYSELEEKAESLRRADQIKSRFLSHMSHEFRTPLNSILALSRLLLTQTDGMLEPEQVRQIEYIQRATGELAEMVNDLLDLAKVESGKIAVHHSLFSVHNLLGALRGMMRPLQSNPSVELRIEDPPPHFMLYSDEAKVSQILRNLVSNALKFTERGHVFVRIYKKQPSTVVFEVEDTGIGIAPEHLAVLFEEFSQIDSHLQRSVKGTGLGLSLSQQLAKLLNGEITVESEPGSGSTFRLSMPTHGDPDPPAQESSNTILVIDDDEVGRYLVVQALRGSSITVTEAPDGLIGLERARFDRPRAILLDLSMPHLSGFDVLDQLRSYPETAHIPVFIYTSRNLTTTELERIARSAQGIIPKGEMNKPEFLSSLSKMLDSIGGHG